MRMRKENGRTERLAYVPGNPAMFAVDQSNFYWITYMEGGVRKIPLTGGTPTSVAENHGNPYSMVSDDKRIYWTTVDGNIISAEK